MKKETTEYDATQNFLKITQKCFPFYFPKLKKKKKKGSAGKKLNDSQ